MIPIIIPVTQRDPRDRRSGRDRRSEEDQGRVLIPFLILLFLAGLGVHFLAWMVDREYCHCTYVDRVANTIKYLVETALDIW